jgi:predicted RNA-binding protein
MSTVVLIACSATKLSKPAPAYQFYSSDLFQKNWEYAKKQTDEKDIYIVSAKHHLVPYNKTLAPYDLTLKDMSSDKRKEWADEVLKQIKAKGYSLDKDKFIFLAGKAYRQYLEPEMKHVETPFEGLRIGQQKKALLKALKEQLISFARYIINEVKKINLL